MNILNETYFIRVNHYKILYSNVKSIDIDKNKKILNCTGM